MSSFEQVNSPSYVTETRPLVKGQTHRDNSSVEGSFTLEFWGVRGQIPTPGKNTVRYGGNTACLEICVEGKRLIFDGGTGLRLLGNHLLKSTPVEAYLFFTNCCWDRIQGFPFFIPAFLPINSFHIYGLEAAYGHSFQKCLINQMTQPNFPVPIEAMRSKLNFSTIKAGTTEIIGDLRIESTVLPGKIPSLNYKVNWHDHSVVYATNHNYYQKPLDNSLIKLAQGADLLIINAPQTNSQPWQDLTASWHISREIVQKSGVKQMIISIHNPDYDDRYLEEIETKLRQLCPQVIFAREGMVFQVV